MNKILTSNKIYISDSKIAKAWRGVFANQDIKKDEIIEVCPVIIVPKNDSSNSEKGLLTDYYFYFGENKKMLALALGFGSIYNHSYEPNATYNKDWENKVINFVAIKNIKKGREITVNYNYGNPDDRTKPPNKNVPAYK